MCKALLPLYIPAYTLSLQLDGIQEQSYLLDPFLEELVTPVVNQLKCYSITVASTSGPFTSVRRLSQLSYLIYSYIKCRGYKTISQSLTFSLPAKPYVTKLV